MENNARSSFKEKLFAMLLCLALILPLAPIVSQETDEVSSGDTWSDINWSDASNEEIPEEAPKTAASEEAPKTAPPKTAAPKAAPKIQGMGTVTALINKVIGYISQIGALFGKTTGIRIGGTSVSAILMLAIAKLINRRGPSWIKWLLYISGGTMIAGSGANITQMIMRFL
jgi:hypothetical protein